MKKVKAVAVVVFSGDLSPSPKAATKALRKAGYEVVTMPEEFRPLLYHPRDDFLEVAKPIVCGAEDMDEALGEMIDELNELVDRYGAIADNFGPIDVDHIPFASVFANRPHRITKAGSGS